MRILMVSPYPPVRDGLANYAVQEVKRLRAAGHDVEVLSPGPSAAHHHLDLLGVRGALALARRVRAYDRVIVQYHPAVFFGPAATPWERAAIYGALAAAWTAAREVELRVHEYPHHGPATRAEAVAARAMFRAATRVTTHTERERTELSAAFGLDPEHVTVADHGAHFERRTSIGRAEARERLGLPADGFMFLSIGFLQPHKGFDRAIQAFAGLADHGCRLDVVGSLRVEDNEYVAYVDELRELADEHPRSVAARGVRERCRVRRVDRRVRRARPAVPADLVLGRLRARRALPPARDRLPCRWPRGPGGRRRDPRRERPGARAGHAHRRRTGRRGAGVGELAHVRARRRDGRDPGRAGRRHPGRVGSPGAGTSSSGARRRVAARTAPLRRVTPLAMPEARSARPGASSLKRVVRRLTAWQIDPIIGQVNRLQQATIDAMAEPAAVPAPPAESETD